MPSINNDRIEGSSYGLRADTAVHVFLDVGHSQNRDEVAVPLKSLVVLYGIKYSQCHRQHFKLFLVERGCEEHDNNTNIMMDFSRESDLDFLRISEDALLDSEEHSQALSCHFPVIVIPEKQLYVTGLCAVLRFLVKNAADQLEGQPGMDLLGYQGGCLNAPAEVSLWTHFCELDALAAVESLIKEAKSEKEEKFIQFEAHLKQPIRIHNIRKRMQQEARKSNANKAGDMPTYETDSKGRERTKSTNGQEVDAIEVYAQEQHIFAEGPDLLLSDVILYPVFRVAEELLIAGDFRTLLPRTAQWLQKFEEAQALKGPNLVSFRVAEELEHRVSAALQSSSEANYNTSSLYKTDPKRENPTARAFTRQHDVDRILGFFNARGGSELLLQSQLSGDLEDEDELAYLDWSELPELVHPLGGHLPQKRLQRKCQQLENLAKSVVDIVKGHPQAPNWQPTLVDFCSGGGHLAILLAYLIPQARVVLVENKAESLRRAMERIQLLGLTNCSFFQCNLDYFRGHFDIGVSLHACGVATDMVLSLCESEGASFVTCPCCYGAVRPHRHIQYPKSAKFRDMRWQFRDYLIIGHTADQTHAGTSKAEQGKRAMSIIDSDRALAMMDSEKYDHVELKRLQPASCTPKNNLIVGVSKAHRQISS